MGCQQVRHREHNSSEGGIDTMGKLILDIAYFKKFVWDRQAQKSSFQ